MTQDPWISKETERKEADFRGLLRMHINICKGIARSGWTAPYLYVDLHAGPGLLEHEGRRFDGSPLIAKDLLTCAGIRAETVHFEQDPEVAGRLNVAMSDPFALLDPGLTSQVHNEPFEAGFDAWLDRAGYQANRYGLIYSDPIGDPIPVATLNRAADLFPRVDLLAYVAANSQYKRVRGQDLKRGIEPTRPLLAEHIAAVRKRVVLIREPLSAHQWTFVLWSNWTDLPQWERHGFWRLDSAKGQHILDRLNLTEDEHRKKANAPLLLDLPLGVGRAS